MRKVYWTVGILIWMFGIPIIFGIWLNHEVQYEYEMNWRTTSDGDNIAIPIAGVFMWNTIIILVCYGIYSLIRKIKGK
jgi:hypothetical protein